MISLMLTLIVFAAEDVKASEVFPMEDVSDLTWAHAVNSREELQDSLAVNVDFIEADVSMGHLVGFEAGPAVPIMAHPPRDVSDLTLERWVDLVLLADTGKGIKLDFKNLEAVRPTLDVLKKHEKKITFPLWLNADILHGPVNSTVPPVSAGSFLQLHKDFFPEATLSIGWTTYFFDVFPSDSWHYGWDHVRTMADVLRCLGLDSMMVHITFPVRAVFACRSLPQLQWLLDTFEKSTLTVFSGKKDPVYVGDLLKIRNHFKVSKIFVDVPEPLLSSFHSKKNPRQPSMMASSVDLDWLRVESHSNEGSACGSYTYINKQTIVFGKNQPSAVVLDKVFRVSEDNRLMAEGIIEFFTTDSPTTEEVAEVNLLLADASSILNTHLDLSHIRQIANQSQLHVFKHNFAESPSSCRYFKLDTQADMAFQAWTIPCDMMMEGLPIQDIIQQQGISEVPKKRRLVLPPGEVMFAVLSSGSSGHAVVHNLNFKGTTLSTTARSSSLTPSTLYTGILLIALYILLLF